jgi:hypothetical protein
MHSDGGPTTVLFCAMLLLAAGGRGERNTPHPTPPQAQRAVAEKDAELAHTQVCVGLGFRV